MQHGKHDPHIDNPPASQISDRKILEDAPEDQFLQKTSEDHQDQRWDENSLKGELFHQGAGRRIKYSI